MSQARNQDEAGSKQCLAYSPTLKVEVTCSSETSIDFQQTTEIVSEKIELLKGNKFI
jgi:hypothetical protein